MAQVTEGRKDDQDKLHYDLLSPYSLEGLVEVLNFGASKYGSYNWSKGMAWSRLFGALMRHLWAWWRGDNLDQETKLSHLKHASACLHFLLHYETTNTGKDDRPKYD